jgi:hypothetical protein
MTETDVMEYVVANGIDRLFDALPRTGEVGANYAVDPTVTEPKAPEYPDLVRLHRAIRERKVTTILEFGCGFSTLVMSHALALNQQEHETYVTGQLRRNNPYELHSVDDMHVWVEHTRARLGDAQASNVILHVSSVAMTTFNDRIATAYDELPNICPDFIYLDGPSQHSVHGSVNGITTAHPDRLPMACDLLRIEHFLLPGTLILVDGRTANARFLKANFQRNWVYEHDHDADIHRFELVEAPLGPFNRRQLEFCLGPQWLSQHGF